VQLARAISLASWPVGAGANITCKYFLCSDEQNDARGDPSVDLAVWLNPIGTEACLWVVSRAWLACDDRVGIVALFAISPHGRSRKCTNITTRRRNHPLAIGFRFGPCRSRVDGAPHWVWHRIDPRGFLSPGIADRQQPEQPDLCGRDPARFCRLHRTHAMWAAHWQQFFAREQLVGLASLWWHRI
jgi:hypothetical protein